MKAKANTLKRKTCMARKLNAMHTYLGMHKLRPSKENINMRQDFKHTNQMVGTFSKKYVG